MSSVIDGGGAGGAGIWGLREGAKPDFCLSEFSYYYDHPRIWKAKYGSDISQCLSYGLIGTEAISFNV